ncbi:unnamed protein product, partial [Ascophyllum nodosum]
HLSVRRTTTNDQKCRPLNQARGRSRGYTRCSMESQVCASEIRETLHRHMGNMKPGEASLRSDRLQTSSGDGDRHGRLGHPGARSGEDGFIVKLSTREASTSCLK